MTKFEKLIKTAHNIHQHLHDIPELASGKVHFRPAENGVTMVGLLSDRPQRGKGGYNAEKLKATFTTAFNKYCINVDHGRPTPEKHLQSFIISDAYRHQRHMQTIQSQLPHSEDTRLYFVTDEIKIEHNGKNTVCDILAINRRKDGIAPVLMELKSDRHMKRLVEQLTNYEAIVKTYQSAFEQLFSALLGEEIHFTAPPEKWLVWTALQTTPDRRETELLKQGIRVVGYTQHDTGYNFHVGQRPHWE